MLRKLNSTKWTKTSNIVIKVRHVLRVSVFSFSDESINQCKI